MFILSATLQSPISLELALSVSSILMTGYFWLVKARQERPNLKIFQLGGFRSSLRKVPDSDDQRRLCLTQVGECGLLIANSSIRQNSIVRFDCRMDLAGQEVEGRWGYVDDDAPPWNIGPESTIGLKLAAFFEVPADYEVPDDFAFRVEFVTAAGQRFAQTLTLAAPEL